MRFLVFAVVVVGCLGITAHARSIKRSSGDGNTKCRGSTPCGWEVYRPGTRTSDFFVNSPCDCEGGTRCVRWRDDISIAAYVYRCRPNDEAGHIYVE